MKMPKFILRIGFQEFAVPRNSGLATLMGLLEDAVPVRTYLSVGEIMIEHTEEGEEDMLAHATMVSIKRIPPGVRWKRKAKDGQVEIVRPVAIEAGRTPTGTTRKAAKRLNGRAPLQLEFGR